MFHWLNTSAPFRAKIKAVIIALEIYLLLQVAVECVNYYLHLSRGSAFAVNLSMLFAGQIAAYTIWCWLTKLITSPIEKLADIGEQLSSGKINSVPFLDRKDCVGRLAKVMSGFSEAIIKQKKSFADAQKLSEDIEISLAKSQKRDKLTHDVIEHLGSSLRKMADGDLTVRIDNPVFNGEFSSLRDAFNESLSRLRSAMNSVSDSYRQIETGATEISTASDDLAKRTEKQAANLGQAAASVRTIAEGVQKNANACVDADHETKEALVKISDASRVMADTSKAMTEIRESSGAISEIISVIDNIAFQTNVLALNAGVEAARAGDAGRGFAVVAQEVRSLAEQSAKSASEIKHLITVSAEQVENGVMLVGRTDEFLRAISEVTTVIAKSIADVSDATRTQASQLQDVTASINDMDTVTQQNAAMVEETTAASHNLRNEMKALADTLSLFKVSARIAAPARVQPVKSKPAHALSAAPSRLPNLKASLGKPATMETVSPDAGWEEF